MALIPTDSRLTEEGLAPERACSRTTAAMWSSHSMDSATGFRTGFVFMLVNIS